MSIAYGKLGFILLDNIMGFLPPVKPGFHSLSLKSTITKSRAFLSGLALIFPSQPIEKS